MTTPVSSPTTPISEVLGGTAAATATPASPARSGQLDKDTFLKLLVAQLKYQDPTNPAEGTEFLAQTAQFTTVERLDEVAKQNGDLLAAQLMVGASSLVGRTVTYADAGTGTEVTGVVASARFGAGGPTLRTGDLDVPLGSVTEVRSGA